MKFSGLRLLSVLLVGVLNVVSGNECLNFAPQADFDIDQFLGPWYALETTSPFDRCLVYDFYTRDLVKSVEITQESEQVSQEEFENNNCVDCENCKKCTNCVDCLDCADCKDCIKYKDCIGCEGDPSAGLRYYGKDEWDCENCKNCINCVNCKNCIDCENCTNCVDLTNCVGCTNVTGSTDCIGCTNTKVSTDCKGCTNCTDCKGCIGCVNGVHSVDCNGCTNVKFSENCSDCTNCKNCKNVTGQLNCTNLWLDKAQSNDCQFMKARPSEPSTIAVPSSPGKFSDYYFTGTLEADPNIPSKMYVSSLPTDDAERPSFVVFATDYTSYAGVYSCRKMPKGYKHYITILSRSEVMANEDQDDLVEFIESINTNPDDVQLKPVDHSDCHHPKEYSSGNSNEQNVVDDDQNVHFTIKFKSEY